MTYSQKAIIKLKNYIKGEFMASVIGVVKSISDKNAKVINNLTKEERTLNVGDTLLQNETIISDDVNFKVEVAKVGGADKVLLESVSILQILQMIALAHKVAATTRSLAYNKPS